MTCHECEILLSDYLDGTLAADVRADFDRHLSECQACAELTRDASAGMAILHEVEEPEPPAWLVTRILAETSSGKHGSLRTAKGPKAWFAGLLGPILQPRLVMGMALTVLSFSMMARCAGVSPRQFKPSDLEPSQVWAAIDDKAHRMWSRTVKFYEDLRFVYEVQSRVREWTEQQDQDSRTRSAEQPLEDRRLPGMQQGSKKGAPAQPVSEPEPKQGGVR